MNNGIIVGRIYRDLEIRTTKNGKQVLEIPIVVNNKKDDLTFISITCFEKLADITYKYCKKGDILGINFIIKNKNWEDESGKKHYDYTFLATSIKFIHKKEESNEQMVEVNQEATSLNQDDIIITDEDLPF